MANFMEEISSGQFALYAQWLALSTFICFFISGILSILSTAFLSAVISFIFAFFLFFFEVPAFAKALPSGPKVQGFVAFFDMCYLRAALYLGVFIVSAIFLQLLGRITSILLLLSAICYAIAGLKGQKRVTSAFTGGSGVANSNDVSAA
ncbi:Golgi apparatus membrane protein tvp18 [Entomophthora muscae]|uniref:Golgi apparatus membrane protein tvp18 n=1 Tax=Entomophthora muscae TaxID=34485 RepID=A0ACC2ST55_9FUNG|nr:Golgi apparatus membrane protein tvp18 [Entomophthora muscae]